MSKDASQGLALAQQVASNDRLAQRQEEAVADQLKEALASRDNQEPDHAALATRVIETVQSSLVLKPTECELEAAAHEKLLLSQAVQSNVAAIGYTFRVYGPAELCVSRVGGRLHGSSVSARGICKHSLHYLFQK